MSNIDVNIKGIHNKIDNLLNINNLLANPIIHNKMK